MSNDLVVGVVIALMVVASVSYMIHQRRKGISDRPHGGRIGLLHDPPEEEGHQQLRLQGLHPLQVRMRIQRDRRRGRMRLLQEERLIP